MKTADIYHKKASHLGTGRGTDTKASDINFNRLIHNIGYKSSWHDNRGLGQGLPGSSIVCSQIRQVDPGTPCRFRKINGSLGCYAKVFMRRVCAVLV